MFAYFAMMLVEKHRTCRSTFVDVVALYRAGLRGYHGTLLLLVALTVWGYGATTLRYFYFLRHCISRSFLVGLRGYDGTLFLHYLIDCKYFVISS